MNRPSEPDQPPSNDQLVLVRLPQPFGYIQLEESLDELEETSADVSLLFWIMALLFFGLGDTISSFLVFSQGGTELNPIMRWSISLPGGLLGFVLVKTAAISILYAISFFWEGTHRWLIPILLMLAGVYLTTNNFLVFMDLK